MRIFLKRRRTGLLAKVNHQPAGIANVVQAISEGGVDEIVGLDHANRKSFADRNIRAAAQRNRAAQAGGLEQGIAHLQQTGARLAHQNVAKQVDSLYFKPVLRPDQEVKRFQLIAPVSAEVGDYSEALIEIGKRNFDVAALGQVQLVGK